MAPNFILTITREGDPLFAEATNQPKFEIDRENGGHYFLNVVDAKITFMGDGKSPRTELILHQNGLDQHAKRVE